MLIGEPHLFGNERALFEAQLRTARRYSEFGLGGSTVLAVRFGIEMIVGVDSDRSFVDQLRAHPEIAPRVRDGSVSLLHADIGPVREWGNPADRTHVERWPNYIATAWAEWGARKISPDLVFVDGRFRVACCYSVALANCVDSGNRAPRIMLHDVGQERPHYDDVLEFFDMVDREGSLCVLKPRGDLQNAVVFARFLQRQFDFG